MYSNSTIPNDDREHDIMVDSMTREEAHKKIYDMYGNEIVYESDYYKFENLIDKIYDDFESRTCENCKHLRYPKDKTYEGNGKCMIGYGKIFAVTINGRYIEHLVADKDFGCNKWEAKDV